MKWTVISGRNIWPTDGGRLSDTKVVEADDLKIVDGCLVFSNRAKTEVEVQIVMAPSLWMLCVKEKERK